MKQIFKFSKLPDCIKHIFESQAEENNKEKAAEIGSIEEHELLVLRDQDNKESIDTRKSHLEIIDEAAMGERENKRKEDPSRIQSADLKDQEIEENSVLLRRNHKEKSKNIDKTKNVSLDIIQCI